LIRDAGGRVLINQRRAGTHRAGEWEFPGGKRRREERPFDALRRELAEELGIDVIEAEPFLRLEHDYGDRLVELDVWHVTRYRGEPHAREGQPLRWIVPPELLRVALLPADRPIVEALLRGR
jgi:8-oxo-dGTP diphosphatase